MCSRKPSILILNVILMFSCAKSNNFPVGLAAGWVWGEGKWGNVERFQDQEKASCITERHETAP
jgi:hypothetical protein